jgi:ligand-binding sensor domain-containing protein
LEDSKGLIWISTREGLSVLDPLKNKFTNITRADGLPDNTVIEMREDDNHNIWASSPNGLSNIMVNRGADKIVFRFVNYNERDGLQGASLP